MTKPLVLVVEDDKPVRSLITLTLETQDYRYKTAEKGSEAIMATLSYQPDLIILDLGLPDMDGVDIIKKTRTWSNVPIIVVSARSEDSDKIAALDAGADDYLTKPFSVDELLARLRVALRRLQFMRNTDTDSTVFMPVFSSAVFFQSRNTARHPSAVVAVDLSILPEQPFFLGALHQECQKQPVGDGKYKQPQVSRNKQRAGAEK